MGQQREEVLTKLRRLITHGVYRPGDIFTEGELTERLKVSRSPLREALAVLSQEGLVEQHHRKGVMVPFIGVSETKEVLKLRSSLEHHVVNRLLESEGDRLEGVEDLLQDMDAAAAAQQVDSFLDADTEFHCGLARQAGYLSTADMLRTLRDKVRVVGLDSLQQAQVSTLASANEDHRQLVQAIRAGEASVAHDLLKRHLDATAGRLLVGQGRTQDPPAVARIRELVRRASERRRHDGRTREAIGLLEEAVDLARKSTGLHHELVQVLLELSAARRQLRDLKTAEKHAQEALGLSTEHQNRAGMAWANSELGRIGVDALRNWAGTERESRPGDPALLTTASHLFDQLGDEAQVQRGWHLFNLAVQAYRDNDLQKAKQNADLALEVFRQADDDDGFGWAHALALLGELARTQGDIHEAHRLLDQARTLAQQKDFKPVLAATALEEGRLLLSSPTEMRDRPGVQEEARYQLRTALDLYQAMRDAQGMSEALDELEPAGQPNR